VKSERSGDPVATAPGSDTASRSIILFFIPRTAVLVDDCLPLTVALVEDCPRLFVLMTRLSALYHNLSSAYQSGSARDCQKNLGATL